MAPSRKKKISLKRRRSSRAPPRLLAPLRTSDNDVLDLWDDGIEQIKDRLRKAHSIENPSPWEKHDSTVKSGVYDLVTRLDKPQYRRSFEAVLGHRLTHEPRMRFSENPFYWALAALVAENQLEIEKRFISRFACQMKYADRHQVPTEYLIGFIYQVGGIERIRNKLNRNEFEDWYPPKIY